jgi:hypothetical protein
MSSSLTPQTCIRPEQRLEPVPGEAGVAGEVLGIAVDQLVLHDP